MDSVYSNGYPFADQIVITHEEAFEFGLVSGAPLPSPPSTGPSSLQPSPTWGQHGFVPSGLNQSQQAGYPPVDPALYNHNAYTAPPASYNQNAYMAVLAPPLLPQQVSTEARFPGPGPQFTETTSELSQLEQIFMDRPGWDHLNIDPRPPPAQGNQGPGISYVQAPVINPQQLPDSGYQTLVPQGMPVPAPVPAPIQAKPKKPKQQGPRKDLEADTDPADKYVKANTAAARRCRENRDKTVAHLQGLVELWKWRATPLLDVLQRAPSPPAGPDLRDNDRRRKRDVRGHMTLPDAGTEKRRLQNKNTEAARKSREGKKAKVEGLKAEVERWRAEAYKTGWRVGTDRHTRIV